MPIKFVQTLNTMRINSIMYFIAPDERSTYSSVNMTSISSFFFRLHMQQIRHEHAAPEEQPVFDARAGNQVTFFCIQI